MSKQTFDFSEALKRMKQGKKVRRKAMPTNSFAYFGKDDNMEDCIMFCQMKLGKVQYSKSEMILTEAILASDWEEVEE